MQFSDFALDSRLIKSIAHMGFDSPTPIQQQAIPTVMAGRDLIASSKTGSGKTLAYLLPAIQRVIRRKALTKRDPRVLILLPTRELATQVFGQVRLFTANTPYRIANIVGGENFNDQAKQLRRDPHFVIATPGRLADHLTQHHLELKGLELLILDEADRMLDLGFAPELSAINQAADHRHRQTLMFSATLDHGQIQHFAKELLKHPERICIDEANAEHQDIQQRFYLCDHLDHKHARLKRFLSEESFRQLIIFTATRADTSRLAELITQWEHPCAALSGVLSQSQRNQIMDKFARGQVKVLVTTDVASRGLDISQISHVMNFDLPKFAEEYVHRIGRTGRAGTKGEAITLVGPKDWLHFKQLESFLGTTISFTCMPGLEGTFKGLKPAQKTKPKTKQVKTKDSNKARAQAKRATTAPKKPSALFDRGEDMGYAPIKRKPRQAPDAIDTDEGTDEQNP